MKLMSRFVLVFAVAVAGPVGAGVVITHSPNYVALSASADTSFDGAVIDVGPHGMNVATAAPPHEPHPPYRNSVSATSTLAPSSTSHVGKDQASGKVLMTFDPGPIGVADTFSILFTGTASAFSALASDGSEADARVALGGFVEFYVDTIAAPAGSFVGNLSIAALPGAATFEGFSIVVIRDNVLDLAFFSAGDPGGDIPLLAGHGYAISAKYSMLVPHGSDPPFSVALQGSLIPAIAAIPEPETYALLLAGLGLIGVAVRRGARRKSA